MTLLDRLIIFAPEWVGLLGGALIFVWGMWL
jgi:hypothetical protein